MKTIKHVLFIGCWLLVAGVVSTTKAHAEQVTLAAWDFTNDVKYTATSTDNDKTYYTATTAPKENMEYTFATQQPFFHPTSGSVASSTLTIWVADANKKWYISNYTPHLRRSSATPPMQTSTITMPRWKCQRLVTSTSPSPVACRATTARRCPSMCWSPRTVVQHGCHPAH